ncbi:MAG: LysM peptidoglycan-binding domain-containing protein [Thermoanaerobaculia bacterium]
MRVRRTGFVLAVVLVAGSVSAPAADRPPRGLHLVGDHWTAWNPPAPAATDQVHVVVKGDTLWGIAAKYYGNAYLWPQIWEKNKYVLDAHWIYPGDPLVLGLNVAPAQTLSQNGAAGTGGQTGTPGSATAPIPEPPANVANAESATGAPVPLGAETDIYCQGYVGDLYEEFPYAVIGAEADSLSLDNYVRGATGWRVGSFRSGKNTTKIGLTTGDIVYVDGGQDRGVLPGTQFTAVLPDQPVVHPVTRDVVGRYYRYAGRVRILSVQEHTAIAEIVQSCDPLTVGALLQPFEPEPVPLGRSTPMRPVNFPAASEKVANDPVIVFSRDDILALGADHVVHVEIGEQDATPGDIYTIYRENQHPGLPPIVMGELAVLSVHKRFSVAKIIESRYPIRLGDRLEPK